MGILLFILMGWIAGVIINRAADNLPERRPLFELPRCPCCGAPRTLIDQFALVSAIVSRGRCRHCQAPLRIRSVAVQAAGAATFAVIWLRFPFGIQTVLAAIYTAVLLLVLVTDLEHRLIYNVVILPAIVFAAVASPWSTTGWARGLLGGVIALSIVLAIYLFGILFERLRGLHIPGGAFGQGDVTLSTFIGLVTGFPAVIDAIVLGILLGGLGAAVLLAYHAVVHRRLALNAVFAYGPYLCIAGWLVMIRPA